MAPPPNKIAQLRKAKKLTQQQLAEHVGAHWITISKLERGKMNLSYDWAEKIGEALDIDPVDLFMRNETLNQVHVEGLIDKESRVLYYEPGQDDDFRTTFELGPEMTGSSSWFHVNSDDFAPILQSGDMLKVSFIKADLDKSAFLERLVVAGWEEQGEQEEVLCILGRGSSEGLFDLRKVTGIIKRDVPVKNLGRVSTIVLDPFQMRVALAGGSPPTLHIEADETD